MGVTSRVKEGVKKRVNIRYYSDYDGHVSNIERLRDAVIGLLFPMEAAHEETFEQAVERFNLSEDMIRTRTRQFLWTSIIFFLFGLMSFVYTGYLIYSKEVLTSFIGLGVTGLIFAYSFRYHFWFFQMKNRKLGCTFQEWWDSDVGGATHD